MKKIDFTDKHILISGGSSGIGLALAKELFNIGADITLLARRINHLEIAKVKINKYRIHPSQQINLISTDVCDYDALSRKLAISHKPFNVLINSAGITYPGEFTKLDPEIFARVMNVNFIGTVNLTKLVVPEMISNNWGYIVNLSSLAAIIGIYGYTAYAPSKYAIRGFSRCLRAELAAKGINVSVGLPPDTDTPQLEFEQSLLPEITKRINQKGGVLSAESVAKAVVRGMKKRQFTIIPGFEGKFLYLFAPLIGRFFYHFAVQQQKDNV